MRIEHINHLDRFLELRNEWNSLRPGSGSSSPALTHQWFSAWLEAFGNGSNLSSLALFDNAGAGEGEKLVGVAPLRVLKARYRGILCSQLRFLYNRHGPRCCFLIRAGYENCASTLIEELLELPGWDIVVLENIPHDSYLYAFCQKLVPSRQHACLLRKTTSSTLLRITGAWDDFFDSSPRNLKRSLRTKEKRISTLGRMTIEHLTDSASAASIMPSLFAIGERSWKTRYGRAIGSKPESREFYSLLADAFGRENCVSIWLMRINDEPVAFEFHIIQDKQVLALRAEFDEKYREQGVGSILDREIVRSLFQTGFKEYDMGGEADFYKLRWTDEVRDHSELLVFGKSATGRLLSMIEKGLVGPVKKVVNPLRA